MESLIKEIRNCKVEWRKLGEVTNYEQPTKYIVKSANYSNDYDIPVLTAGKTFILGYTNEKEGVYKAFKSPVIIFDDFTTANKWVDFDFKVKSSAMKLITSKDENEVLLKYIYYWLNTLPNEISANDHKRQWINNYCKKTIPIPPLDIQKKIVKILDKFTELTTKLSTELTLRKKQYSYYLNKLLTFRDDEVEWRKLGDNDIISIEDNKRKPVKASLRIKGAIPYYGANNIQDYVNGYTHNGEYVLIAEDGSKSLENYSVQWVSGKFWANNHVHVVRSKNENILKTKFLYFYLTKFNFIPYLSGNERAKLTKTKMCEIPIPIPSLKKQKEIVAILDKFHTLTNSLTKGLPREIELRKKQYEYYRNLLLDFKKD